MRVRTSGRPLAKRRARLCASRRDAARARGDCVPSVPRPLRWSKATARWCVVMNERADARCEVEVARRRASVVCRAHDPPPEMCEIPFPVRLFRGAAERRAGGARGRARDGRRAGAPASGHVGGWWGAPPTRVIRVCQRSPSWSRRHGCGVADAFRRKIYRIRAGGAAGDLVPNSCERHARRAGPGGGAAPGPPVRVTSRVRGPAQDGFTKGGCVGEGARTSCTGTFLKRSACKGFSPPVRRALCDRSAGHRTLPRGNVTGVAGPVSALRRRGLSEVRWVPHAPKATVIAPVTRVTTARLDGTCDPRGRSRQRHTR